MAQVSYGTITITDTNDIESIIIEYASNQSTTTPPTQTDSGWSTNRPTWAQGYYIWQRTRIHKSGTQTSADTFGTAVCLTGSTGQTGPTGKGITGVETLYATNNSTTTAPTSGWQPQPPTYSSLNPKYWVKVTTTYNTGDPTVVTYLDNGITDAMATAAAANQTANNAKDKADIVEGNLNNYITSNNNVVADLQTRTKYFWTNLVAHTNGSSGWTKPNYPVGTYAASGISGTTFDEENSSTYGYNTLYSNGIKLRYNAFNLGELTGTSLVFYKPSTASQGTMAMKLDGTSLNFYDSTGQTVQASFGGTQATVSGTINAYDGVISGSVTIGGVLASTISSKSECITKISNTGVWVTPANKTPDANGAPDNDTTGTLINADNGVSIYNSGVLVANYGSSITLGQANNPRFLIASTGISFVNASDTSLFNIQPNSEKTEYSEKEAQVITYSDENDVPTSFPYTISITDSTASTYLSDETSAPSPEIIITSNGESLQNPNGITATVTDRTRVDITINQQGAETILNFMKYTVDTTYKRSTDTTINSSKTYYNKEGEEFLELDPDSFEGDEDPQSNGWYEVDVLEHVSYNSCTINVRYYSVKVNYYSSLMNIVGNIKVAGRSNVIEINNTQWTSQEPTDTFYRAKNDKTGTSVAFGVGSGGVNHGIWSTARGHWLIYGSDDSYIRIPKATLIGGPSDYGTTTNASRINAGYIQLSKNGGSSYLQIRSGQYVAAFTVTKDGTRGLYDTEKQKWIIYSTSSGNVYIPQKLLVNGEYVQVTNNTGGGAYFKAVSNNKAVSLYSTAAGTRGVYDSYKSKWIIYNVTDLVHIPMKVQMENGATISSGSLAVSSGDISATDNTNVTIGATCNSKTITLHCNTSGNRGVYHSTGSHWLIYTNDDNKAHIPVALITGSSITAGGSINASASADIQCKISAGAGDIYLHCYNSSTGDKGIWAHNASGTAQNIFKVAQNGTTTFSQTCNFSGRCDFNGTIYDVNDHPIYASYTYNGVTRTGFGSGSEIFKVVTPSRTTDSTGISFMIGSGAYAVGSGTSSSDTSINTENTAMYLCGGSDSTSRFLRSYTVYQRTYTGVSANVYVTSSGVLGRPVSSSIRYKHDVEYITNEEYSIVEEEKKLTKKQLLKGTEENLANILNIPVVKFKFNEGYVTGEADFDYSKPIVGLIADDVAEIAPDCATYIENEDGEKIPESWNSDQLLVRMLYVVQQQEKRIQELENTISNSK